MPRLRSITRLYEGVLGFGIVEEWNEAGDIGCVLTPIVDDPVGCIEIYGMSKDDVRYHASFSEPFTNDKVDIQLRTPDLQPWIDQLKGRWPFSQPEETTWGHRWIKLRDPDNLLIAIYEIVRPQSEAQDAVSPLKQ